MLFFNMYQDLKLDEKQIKKFDFDAGFKFPLTLEREDDIKENSEIE